jgi:transposase
MVKKRMDEATNKRVRAGRLLQKGKTPAEIALDVGVARQTVYTWKALFNEGGIDALRAVPSRGRPARLDEAQREDLRRALLQNPTEHGLLLASSPEFRILIRRPQGIVTKRFDGPVRNNTLRTSKPKEPRAVRPGT